MKVQEQDSWTEDAAKSRSPQRSSVAVVSSRELVRLGFGVTRWASPGMKEGWRELDELSSSPGGTIEFHAGDQGVGPVSQRRLRYNSSVRFGDE
jgi:hypothetical protein